MDIITIISIIIILITTTLFIYFMLKVNKLLIKEFKALLNIVGGLKFRVFEHETQLLGRKGVYIPEDAAEFVFNIIWSMISDKQKSELEKEYKENCPSHIPLWKYILYNYRVDAKLTSKEPFMRIDSPEDILVSNFEQIGKDFERITRKLKMIDELVNTDKTKE